MCFPDGSGVNNLPANAGDTDASSILGSGRSPEEGNATQSNILGILENWKIPWKLENPMDRGACQATVHGVTKESDTT